MKKEHPLKTSNPQDHFLTVLRNGKVGKLRMQTSMEQARGLVGNHENVGAEYLYDGDLELFFDPASGLLRRAKVKFGFYEGIKPWHQALNLTWVDWLSRQSMDGLFSLLISAKIPFKRVAFRDQAAGLLVEKAPATLLVLFDADGKIYEFSWILISPMGFCEGLRH